MVISRTLYTRPVSVRLTLPLAAGYALLFLMIFAPTAYSLIKAALLLVALAGTGLRVLKNGQVGVHPSILLRTILFSTAGLFFVVVGSLRGNPGALAMAPVFVVWPIVYVLLIGGISAPARLEQIIRLLVVATLVVEASMYAYLLDLAFGLGLPILSHLDLGQGAAPDLSEFRMFSIASLLFLVPFLIGALLLWPRHGTMPVRRRWIWIAIGLALPLVLLSGRRGLWVSVALAPGFALLIRTSFRRGVLRDVLPWRRVFFWSGPITVGAFASAQAVAGVKVEHIWRWLQQGFDFTTGDSGLGRALQFRALVHGWSESPLIGKGLGAVTPTVIRSTEQPWAYELVYVALLFATGIVGVVLYTYGVAWMFRQARAMIQSESPTGAILLSVLVGTFGMIVGNATNPYLTKFDGLWTLFLPLAFINSWLLGRDEGP